MKKTSLVIVALFIASIIQAQIWKPFEDYERNVWGFEDASGNRQDMKYKEAVLVDETNPLYTIVGYAKKGNDKVLHGVVDNNTLELVIPISDQRISVLGNVLHVEYAKDSYSYHEFYTSNMKKIIPQPITGDGFDVSTSNNFITYKDKDGKRGVVDYTGKVVIPFTEENTRIFILDGGYFSISSDDEGWNHNTRVMDATANIIIPKKPNLWYSDFNNGYFIVDHLNSNGDAEYSSICDLAGKDILVGANKERLVFDDYDWSTCPEQLFQVYKSDFEAYYSKKGKLVVPFYNSVSHLTCTLFEVGEGNDWYSRIYGVYSIEEKRNIVPLKYYSITFIKEENKIKAFPIKDNYTTFDLYDLNGNKLKQ